MKLRNLLSFIATIAIFAAAVLIGRLLWAHYMDSPWTRDGRVRADIINIAPDVSGEVVEFAVRDNQFVHRGDVLMRIDPDHYRIAVEQAQARRWEEPLVSKVEQERRDVLPAEQLQARQRWRDLYLMSIVANKKSRSF